MFDIIKKLRNQMILKRYLKPDGDFKLGNKY
jgi:hypothetical protein